MLTVRICLQRKLNQVRLASEVNGSSLTIDARSVTSNKVAMLPVISTKKRQAKACRFFIHCESDGISSHFGVYIIAIGVYHQPQVASSFAMMIYNFYEIGDMQNFVLMICNGSAIDFSVRLASEANGSSLTIDARSVTSNKVAMLPVISTTYD